MTSIPPPIHTVDSLQLPVYESSALDNEMELYSLQGGSEPVLKLELVFRAGASYEAKSGVAECMAGLMSEGTIHLSSADLAEKIEAYGATLQTRGGVDTVRVRLYTLRRFFPALIDLINDVMAIPAFDEKEAQVYFSNKLERLQIDLKKNEVLAYRHLTEAIYGKHHPYGRNVSKEDVEALTIGDLQLHHQRFIAPKGAMAFLSGSFGPQETELVNQTIGKWQVVQPDGAMTAETFEAVSAVGRIEIDGPQHHQAAIRLGRKLFTQHHPDFDGLFVLNTILGGYFGSRLMTEVRENQGLTYGIYSGIDSFARDGCFYVSTETAPENIEKVIDSVSKEMEKLCTTLIDDDELQMARNYLMGHLMTQLDGPFASLDYVKTLKIERLRDEVFARTVDTIQQITPGKLRNLARQYLNPSEWVTIVVK